MSKLVLPASGYHDHKYSVATGGWGYRVERSLGKDGFMSVLNGGLRHGPTSTVLTSSGWVLVPLSVCSFFPNTLHSFHLHSAICDGVDAYPHRWKITPNDMRTSAWSPLKIQPLTFTICDWQGPWRCTRAHLQDPYLPAQFMSILCSDWYDLDPKDVRTDYHHLTPPKFISRYTATKAHRICL